MNILRFASTLSALLLTTNTSCSVPGDLGDALGHALACAFDHDFFVPVDSDAEILKAAVTCSEGSDCIDRRSIHRGAEMEFVIRIREALGDAPFEVRSDPPELLTISGFTDEPQQCDDGREISGTVVFTGTGSGALSVLSGGEELDRFTVDVQEPSSIDIQYSTEGPFGPFHTSESVSLIDDVTLRALVRGGSGDRLVGGPAGQWSLPDTEILSFEDGARISSGSIVTVEAAAFGETVVSVTVGDLSAEVPLIVGETQTMGGATGE